MAGLKLGEGGGTVEVLFRGAARGGMYSRGERGWGEGGGAGGRELGGGGGRREEIIMTKIKNCEFEEILVKIHVFVKVLF